MMGDISEGRVIFDAAAILLNRFWWAVKMLIDLVFPGLTA